MSEGNKPDNEDKKSDLVITPGGPRPKDHVHSVRPGEAVSVDDQGRAHVVPLNEASSMDEKESTNMSDELVLTPGGYRPKSRVHLVEPGYGVDVAGDQLRLVNLKTMDSIAILETSTGVDELADLGSSWIAYAYWMNDTGKPLTSFLTTWVVPAEPASSSGQLIYLFNGISPANTSAAILQPVLQWGHSEVGGGAYWSVASWYVLGGNGSAFHSSSVRVNVGQQLVGAMTLTGSNGGLFSYKCEFVGIEGTSLPINNIEELVWCNETLEAYNLTQCSDYPSSVSTAFKSINVRTGDVTPSVNWSIDNRVTDCGQHAEVVTNSATNGRIDIYY